MTVPPLPSHFARLDSVPAGQRLDLLATPVAHAIAALPDARVFAIDPDLADTAALNEAFDLPGESAANCVLVAGRRGDDERWVACLALATTRVDVNKTVRKKLDVRKASFAPMDEAVGRSGMEYGGITPVGLPDEWPIWIDAAVHAQDWVCIGAGIRGAKLLVPGASLAGLPHAEVVEGLAA
ncbi:YbaK/EbsC family protein [Aestuariimicrobium soli]|uniref:YbaK/EbsC family protein n=1 Tax=Aestuariimicrobium soli TaxID=2035834 RepID=UPI003EBC60F8